MVFMAMDTRSGWWAQGRGRAHTCRVRRLGRLVAIGLVVAAAGALVVTASCVGQPKPGSARAGGSRPAQATITGQIWLAGPGQTIGLPGTVWAYEHDINGDSVASANTDSDGRFTLSVPAPGVYVIGGDSPKFNGGSPIPTYPVAACVSSPVTVSPHITATVHVLCQAQ